MKKNRMRIGLFLTIICTVCGILVYFLLPTRKPEKQPNHLRVNGPYFISVPICQFSSANIPHIQVAIEDKKILTAIDLGFGGGLSLPIEVLQDLNKRLIGNNRSFGIRGKQYENDVYELSKLKVGRLTISPVYTDVANPEFEIDSIFNDDGTQTDYVDARAGWRLFYNFNLLLDCGGETLAFCDSIETLNIHGYPVDSFIETPLLLDRNLIEFIANTEDGPLRCILDTGSTWNFLNKDLEGGANDHILFTPENIHQFPDVNPENIDLMIIDEKRVYDVEHFNIGDHDFGLMTFKIIRNPFAIECIIGMEFLKSKIIFIDFPNRKLYISCS